MKYIVRDHNVETWETYDSRKDAEKACDELNALSENARYFITEWDERELEDAR